MQPHRPIAAHPAPLQPATRVVDRHIAPWSDISGASPIWARGRTGAMERWCAETTNGSFGVVYQYVDTHGRATSRHGDLQPAAKQGTGNTLLRG